ncbi:glycosyltransferase [Verrucomicrobiota bacterium]
MKLSIIIPAHNEEKRIGRMFDAYLPFFTSRYGDNVEFITVINGTSDRTEDVVRKYREKYPNLRYIVEPKSVGKGGALMLGFPDARGDLIGFSDADGSTTPEAFQDLVDNIGDSDAIIASRWCRGAKVSPRQPLLRRIASRVFNLLTRIFFGLPLTDTQCGAKLIKREAVIRVLSKLGLTHWAFDVDLLFQLKRAGYKIIEIPTTWHDVEGSKIEITRVSLEMFAALTRLRLLYSPFAWVVTLYNKYLGPFIHPPGLEQDHLFRHSLLLMVGMQIASFLNVLFQIAMMRMLSGPEYGDMAVMLRVFLIVSFSVGAFRWTMAHFTARLIKEGNSEKVKSMIADIVRSFLILGILIFALLVVGSSGLAGFFNVESSKLIIVMGVSVIAGLYSPILAGVLNGCQAFTWLSGTGIAWGLIRLVFAITAVAMGFSAVGAMSGHATAMAASIVIYIIALRKLLGPGISRTERVVGVYPYFFKYVIALTAFAVLMNADVLIVKHYFDSVTAGYFAKASVIASIVVFLPQPIAMAMFPKVVSSGDASYASCRILLKALALAAFIIGSVALACTIFPQFFLWLFKGDRSFDSVPLLRGMVWALCPVSMVFVIMSYELAQRRFMITLPLIICAVGYIAGVTVWHETPLQIVAVLGISGVFALAFSIMCLPWRVMRKGK